MLKNKASEIIKFKSNEFHPEVGIILGSGLGSFIEEIEKEASFSFVDLPGFPNVSVKGHSGKLILGNINGLSIAILEGRSHYYEDADADAMKVPIQTLKDLGCKTLILTNSAGSIVSKAQPGSIVLINDHINYMGVSPLFGERGNTRFVNMVDAYNPLLNTLFKNAAKDKNISLHEGVYFWFCGPNFETPAEIRGAKLLGGDVVGMSTVPEVIIARHLSLKVAVLSVITNMAAGIDNEPLSHERTIENAKKGIKDLTSLLIHFLKLYSIGSSI